MAYIGEVPEYTYNQELGQPTAPVDYRQPIMTAFRMSDNPYYLPQEVSPLYYTDEMRVQDEYQRGLIGENLGQFQEYTGEQLGGLFSAINEIGESPYVAGNPLANAPRYNPYGGTRENFQTQQGYNNAQIDHMNNYLNQIGSYFGSVGNPQTPSSQSILANAPSQGSPPPMPSVGMNFNVGGIGSAPNPFQSFGVGSGGWGNSQIGTGGWGTPLGGGGWNATAPAVAGWGTTTPNSLFGGASSGGSGLSPNTSSSMPTPSSYPTPQPTTAGSGINKSGGAYSGSFGPSWASGAEDRVWNKVIGSFFGGE